MGGGTFEPFENLEIYFAKNQPYKEQSISIISANSRLTDGAASMIQSPEYGDPGLLEPNALTAAANGILAIHTPLLEILYRCKNRRASAENGVKH